MRILEGTPRRSEWLFLSRKNASHIKTIYDAWNRVRMQAGLKDIRLHDLRHSFASFLVNLGCFLYKVQKILGYQNRKIATRYTHLAQDSLLRATNIVGDKLGDLGGKRHSCRKTVGMTNEIIYPICAK